MLSPCPRGNIPISLNDSVLPQTMNLDKGTFLYLVIVCVFT